MIKGTKILAANLLNTVFITSAYYQHKNIKNSFNQNSYLVGSEPVEVILPQSKEPVKAVKIKGSQLKEGETYIFNAKMKLIIEGDVPPQTSILVENGALEVTGNVGYKASLSVKVPSFTNKNFYPCVQLNEKGESIPSTCSDIKELGPIPPYNNDDAIVIWGKVHQTVKIQSSYLSKVKIKSEQKQL